MKPKQVAIKFEVKTAFGRYFCTERRSDGLYVGTVASSINGEGVFGALREIRIFGPYDQVSTDAGTMIEVRQPKDAKPEKFNRKQREPAYTADSHLESDYEDRTNE